VLELRDVGVRFGGVWAVKELSFSFKEVACQAVIGPNGAGKTSLFNLCTGLVRPTTGHVSLGGRSFAGESPDWVFRRGVTRTFQSARLFENLSVLDNVRLAAERTPIGDSGNVSREDARSRSRSLLDYVRVPRRMWSSSPKGLPLLERRMIELARALAGRPRYLLLDEPASGLNTMEKLELGRTIAAVGPDFDCRVVVVEHDMRLVMDIAEHIWVLNFGSLISSGTPSAVQSDPLVIDAYLGEGRK
jgi:ABC-type branched-subunit amino acid transport system ATPase component